MNDNEFWLKIWGLAAAVVIVFILAISVCTINSDAAIVSMVERGIDPVKARCAIYNADTTPAAAVVCTLTVSK